MLKYEFGSNKPVLHKLDENWMKKKRPKTKQKHRCPDQMKDLRHSEYGAFFKHTL